MCLTSQDVEHCYLHLVKSIVLNYFIHTTQPFMRFIDIDLRLLKLLNILDIPFNEIFIAKTIFNVLTVKLLICQYYQFRYKGYKNMLILCLQNHRGIFRNRCIS